MSAQPAAPARSAPDRRTSTIQKRASLLPKPSSIVIDPSVLIAQHAQLTGTHPITVGPNTVLHPHSKISSTLAPVVLGDGVVVYERAKVGVGMGEGADADSRRSSMNVASARSSVRDSMRGEGTLLARNVVIETNAVVEAAEVGEGSVVEVGAVLGRGCVLGKVHLYFLELHVKMLTRHSFALSQPSRSSLQTPICPITQLYTVAPSAESIGPSNRALNYSR